ncbi:hypothetical protein WICANDRAFT_31937 [Wickerhamomyces anomalus NRRL Y-366-8]|uniref:GABA-specific permease n=1 Tax=Wickerhamomyces anomalus (strain ATCC 58044 / CBS 1984 / NCYC 433 / NRRL Y-366-8) TaxID=683960 RepID=A0A1E3P2D3_WICAA|nr:uncharacterized protein WICANDRAFT_31937 [Wickerhamomyces anomalus NRRL Y-366-8]ODQ59503.1 hypothetical protein WICANDRAFT_31937 [Wickerhamomyces anomalus NRRL Y-366-8]
MNKIELTHVTSREVSSHDPSTSISHRIDARHVTDPDELLAEIGYKPELKRTFGTLEVFGIAFSIMGLLPSIATVMSMGLTGGPVTLLWGWFIAGFLILTMGIAMSEMASSIPTSGGLYYWTHYFAPPSLKNTLSFIIGTSNSLSLTGGVCSITYGFAQQVLAAAYLGSNGSFKITNAMTFGVFAAGIIAEFLITCFASGAISRLQTTSIVANVILIVIFFIALPIGTAKNASFNDASFIFGKFENSSTWPSGWAFIQFGFGGCAWVISGFDSCIHMAEEAKNPSKSIPYGIIGSITVCWITGFFIMIVIGACITPDIASILQSSTGQPLAQIFYDSLGQKWAVAFISLSAICQFFMAASCMTASSRQIWAFARDDGLPFSSFIKVVNKKFAVPIRAVVASAIAAATMGLLILAGPIAANALFSISIIGNYVSWSTPQVLRLFFSKNLFKPGPFYLGKVFSPIVVSVSILAQYLILVFSFFPTTSHVSDAKTMNYAIVVNVGAWSLALIYYFSLKRNIYIGPKSNLPDEEFIEGIDYDVHGGKDSGDQISYGKGNGN